MTDEEKARVKHTHRKHYWRDQILRYGPNTVAREELILMMVERLDRIEDASTDSEACNAFTEADLWRLLFKEVRELRSVVNQLFELLTTDEPRKS